MQNADYLDPILRFLSNVGIEVRLESIDNATFLPGIEVRQGSLVADLSKLLWPGDLLHEAGHLAVLPRMLRQQASDDLKFEQSAPHAGELEAMAWAYAAAVDLDLPLDVLFHEGGYKGQSAGLRMTYSMGVYPGLPGLCLAGMAVAPNAVTGASANFYPQMLRWLRADDALPGA